MTEVFIPSWPDKPTCHGGGQMPYTGGDFTYRPPRVDPGSVEEKRFCTADPFRTCSYCGSIHPEDLYNALKNGATLGGSDWKYGWPHKFYVSNIPSPLEGQQTVRSSESFTDDQGVRQSRYTTSTERKAYGKFYNEHIKDITDDVTRGVFCDMLAQYAGIHFTVTPEGLKYRAPYRGFQATNRAK